MQKAFGLQPNEIEQARQIEEDRRTVLAQIGALTLDMESARAQLPAVEQRRRQYLQALVQHYGITEYRSARIEGPNLICDLPDGPPAPPPVAAPAHVNGVEVLTARE